MPYRVERTGRDAGAGGGDCARLLCDAAAAAGATAAAPGGNPDADDADTTQCASTCGCAGSPPAHHAAGCRPQQAPSHAG